MSEIRERIARALLFDPISDSPGSTAPEIIAGCESAADAVIEALGIEPRTHPTSGHTGEPYYVITWRPE